MKCCINRDELLKPLKSVISVIQSQQILPILANIVLSVDKHCITLIGSDAEMELMSKAKPMSVETTGSITVPGKKLLDICQALPPETEITFSVEDAWAKLSGGESFFNLATLASQGFPRISIDENSCKASCSLTEAQLLTLLQRTQFAMAQEDVRYFLNGMLLELSNQGISTVATDGHRLALNRLPSLRSETEISAIIPRKAVQELLRLLKEEETPLSLTIHNKYLKIQGKHFSFITRLIDATYPPYQELIPKDCDKQASIPTYTLKQGLIKTAILANEKFRSIQLSLKENTLSLLAKNTAQEYAKDALSIQYTGPETELAFNINYLLDLLSALNSETLHMMFSQGNRSVLFVEKDTIESTFVIMPVTL